VKELSDQTRAIIAAGLCLIVIIGWSYIYKPPKPPVSSVPETTQVAPQAPGAPASNTGATGAPSASAAAVSGVPAGPVTAAPAEKIIVVESDLYRVALSNRGGVVRSWLLKKYTDEGVPPRTLDVVSADLAQQSGGWPLSLQLNDPQLEAAANQALYVISTPSGSFTPDGVLTAPAEIDFEWSDGRVAVTKRLKFDKNYVANLEVSVLLNNMPLPQSVAWRGGFGDATVVSRRG
jgi:YidC/Oxa1 family membrane protein insertase